MMQNVVINVGIVHFNQKKVAKMIYSQHWYQEILLKRGIPYDAEEYYRY